MDRRTRRPRQIAAISPTDERRRSAAAAAATPLPTSTSVQHSPRFRLPCGPAQVWPLVLYPTPTPWRAIVRPRTDSVLRHGRFPISPIPDPMPISSLEALPQLYVGSYEGGVGAPPSVEGLATVYENITEISRWRLRASESRVSVSKTTCIDSLIDAHRDDGDTYRRASIAPRIQQLQDVRHQRRSDNSVRGGLADFGLRGRCLSTFLYRVCCPIKCRLLSSAALWFALRPPRGAAQRACEHFNERSYRIRRASFGCVARYSFSKTRSVRTPCRRTVAHPDPVAGSAGRGCVSDPPHTPKRGERSRRRGISGRCRLNRDSYKKREAAHGVQNRKSSKNAATVVFR